MEIKNFQVKLEDYYGIILDPEYEAKRKRLFYFHARVLYYLDKVRQEEFGVGDFYNIIEQYIDNCQQNSNSSWDTNYIYLQRDKLRNYFQSVDDTYLKADVVSFLEELRITTAYTKNCIFYLEADKNI